MANTRRPPPPVMNEPLRESLESEAVGELGELEQVIDSSSPPRVVTAPPPPLAATIRGGEDDVLDLSALAKLGTSAPPVPPPPRASARPSNGAHHTPPPPPPPRSSGRPMVASARPVEPERRPSLAPRLSLPNDAWEADPVVLPRRQPAWLIPLLVGLGAGAGLSAVLFATSGRSAHEVAARVPAPASAAPSDLAPAPAPVVPEAAPAAAPAAAAPSAPVEPAQVAPAPAVAAPIAAAPAAAAPKSAVPVTPIAPRRDTPAPMPAQSIAMHTSMRPTSASAYGSSTPYDAPAPSPAPRPAADPAPAAGPVLVMRPTAEDAPAPAAPPPPAQPVATAAAPAANAKPRGTGIDALLDDALSPEAKRAEQARSASAAQAQKPQTVPVTPSRDDVAHTMTGLQLAIRGCAMGQTGVATAAMMVRYDGRVSSVQVTGAPFGGTASGRCMEGVLRNAQFPRFRQPTFTVHYPFSID